MNEENFISVARDLFGHKFEMISQYVDILTNRGVDWGLLGPREPDRIWGRHILNSLAVADCIPCGSRVADVGSGAGLPGIPLAIYRPDISLTLIESMDKRSRFLRLAVEELGLSDRVTVIRERAENIKDSFDVVTCRAVAPLSRLLTWTANLFMPKGSLIALKGQTVEEEIRDSTNLLEKLQLDTHISSIDLNGKICPTTVLTVQSSF